MRRVFGIIVLFFMSSACGGCGPSYLSENDVQQDEQNVVDEGEKDDRGAVTGEDE
jgi:predicted small lipoprotein YifL